MDVIVCHWVGLVSKNKVISDGFGCTVEEEAEFFYAYDGTIASTNLMWPQWSFVMLIGLFEIFRLRTNVVKTVTMICHPGTLSGIQPTAYYGRWMNREGGYYRLSQRQRMMCEECGA